MTILAYSELLKRITGIDEKRLEMPFVVLNRNNTTKNRLSILKALAEREPITIGFLLQKSNQARGGGSYLTIRKYFESLEKEGLLKRSKIKSKTLWSFSEEYHELKKYILG
ncbi:MAG: hypothetical protein ACMXX8_01230 [Candidatus Woesearchaeota archaeon]